jgi:hypothetical protein
MVVLNKGIRDPGSGKLFYMVCFHEEPPIIPMDLRVDEQDVRYFCRCDDHNKLANSGLSPAGDIKISPR